MRCFFNILRGAEIIPDRKGVEVSDLNEARQIATETISEMLRQGELSNHDLSGRRLEVVDLSGTVLLTFGFDQLLG